MIRSINFISTFVLLISSFSVPALYASGNKEEPMNLEPVSLEEINLSEISEASIIYFSKITGYFPREISVTVEVTDHEHNLLHDQQALVYQEIMNGEIFQDISPVIAQPSQVPERSGGQDKGRSGPPSGDGPPGDSKPMDSKMNEKQSQYSASLTQAALKFWNTTREIISGISNGEIREIMTEETCYIFDFPCVGFDLKDSENGIIGRVWVDIKGAKPLKLSLHDDTDPDYSLEIYLLPSTEMGVRISSLFFSQRMEEENNDKNLILNGNIAASDWAMKGF
jgi:hypothetical protein